MCNYSAWAKMNRAVLSMVVALICISASSARGQRSSPGAERDRNLRDRELQITLLEKGANQPGKRESRLLPQEINEDFARLQVVNNDIKLKTAAAVVLDSRVVSEAAAEIKKRSSRLRTNLVFPESAEADDKEKTPRSEGLKAQLVTLDRLIRSLVTNPVFTEAGVINAQLAGRARGDLDEIINLSDNVKTQAASLNKVKASSH